MQLSKQRFVLDTTALTSQEIREGRDLCTTMEEVLNLIAEARTKLNISCHVPFPTVYNELMEFIKRYKCKEDIKVQIDTWLVKKTPNRFEVKIPSAVFYEYVQDMRERMNRGMKIGETAIWLSSAESISLMKESKEKDAIKRAVGKIIRDFRAKYRNALRYGTLDSAPDLDVLLLAKELEAGVVASDEGIKKWAERLGLRYVEGASFPKMLKEYLEHV
ncbi:MAG: RNA ligase partner protein [Candidatus Hydrothermarchaeota archaeon]|nr:MAG: RNA ligase partner protein [Candidatus Hydrothermarchaeota archaeon]